MDENEKYDIYARAADNFARIKREEEQKKKEEAQKEKNLGPELLFTKTRLDSAQAKYVAQALFPVLAEVIPESLKTTDRKMDLLKRMFGGPEAYVKRTAMNEMYRDLQGFKRTELKNKFKFTDEEIKKIFASDVKRHKLMEAIAAITGYTG